MALSEEVRAKSTFVTRLGKFEFTHSPFGLVHAPNYFHQLKYEVLKGLEFAFGYLDNILVFGAGVDIHLQHLCILFDRLREPYLKLRELKCNFSKAHIQYLRHLISS